MIDIDDIKIKNDVRGIYIRQFSTFPKNRNLKGYSKIVTANPYRVILGGGRFTFGTHDTIKRTK